MQLSQNFSLLDLIKSPTATRKGIDNTPDNEQIANLSALCKNILEPLRLLLNSEIIITSGFRSPKLNVAIGGSKTSSHCKAEAADFEVQKMSNKEAFEIIRKSGLIFDQLIAEGYDEQTDDFDWIHISYRIGNNRKQVLKATFVNGKPIYTPF